MQALSQLSYTPKLVTEISERFKGTCNIITKYAREFKTKTKKGTGYFIFNKVACPLFRHNLIEL